MFLNQPVKNALADFVFCEFDDSIYTAAKIMTDAQKSSILVRGRDGKMNGIVTDVVLRERVVAGNLSPDIAVSEVMSSPLIHVDDTALIFEAVLLLQERGIKHLAVRNKDGEVISVISNEELLDVHRYSAAFLIEEIRESGSVEEISASRERLPRIVKALIDSGAHAENITRIITTVSDTILGRLIDFAIEQLGEPPARFAFISLGSEGRSEQTLVTDQDNAIIFEDIGEDEKQSVHGYFQEFSTTVCTWLDQVGYDFCNGNVMAMNTQWCQPLSQWKQYFTRWITESSPEDLMEVSIFFDFRCLYGDNRFVDDLREHISSRTENKAAFLYQLAQNTLLFKVPLDFFGKIAVESGGDHPNTFNIKHVMAQIVGFARIYAVNYSIESTNTLKRIDILFEKNVLNKVTHEELVESYNYLMQLRFRHQVSMIDRGEPPDNHVNINELSHMEKELFEKIFSQVNRLRKRLSLVGHNEIYF
jgi:CBS domain-containing protein